MAAYYNEIEPFAAAWLRELIAKGLIAPGDVDTRSIVDVRPDDLRGYTQCHFFAGIAGWSLALRRAGWPDDRPVWTGSCPCQPFSESGRGLGFEDERHLWPAFFNLIAERRPHVVLGEQVASPLGLAWLDLVYNDLEGADYAVGALDTCAAGFGAPQIRQRLYWAACVPGGLAVSNDTFGRPISSSRHIDDWSHARWAQGSGDLEAGSGELGLDLGAERSGWINATLPGLAAGARGLGHGDSHWPRQAIGGLQGSITGADGGGLRPGPTNGFWGDADWLQCTDGGWRAVEPGSFPLAERVSARVGRLRGYGNAVVPAQASGFVQAMMEALA